MMTRTFLVRAIVAALVWAPAVAAGHAMAPALVSMTNTGGTVVDIVLKRPIVSGRVSEVTVGLPERCQSVRPRLEARTDDALVSSWSVDCGVGALAGETIELLGLSSGLREVIVTYDAPGTHFVGAALAGTPRVTLPDGLHGSTSVSGYLRLGVQHILEGADHLLFVLGLLLIALRRRERGLDQNIRSTLLTTVTAFTVAHSLTLAAVVAGGFALSPRPVELTIAGSILLLAFELSRVKGAPTTLTLRRPAWVAFAFGLLHGCGFAGALGELGLPEHAIGWALLSFNIGVEFGQLIFVFVMVALWAVVSRIENLAPRLERAAIYAMGSAATFWCAQRVMELGST